MEGVEYKRCSRCKRELPATAEFFHRNRSDKRFGLHHYCKQCMKERNVPRSQRRKGKKESANMVISVVMSEYPKMFELLKVRAKELVRTAEEQALFYVIKGISETVIEKEK